MKLRVLACAFKTPHIASRVGRESGCENWIIFFSAIALAVTAQSISVAASDTEWDRTVLPRPPQPFEGVTKRTLEGSVASFTQPVKAPADAPNILLVLIDDAGFGNPSTFGGPVATPTFDKLAAEGLRYNRFHVTALCSPTRAALLSGRNHHAMGFGSIAEMPGGWPGYSTNWPTSAASIAKILQANGYNTAAIGKWHLTPDTQQGPSRAFRSLAERARLRLFLGISRRRNRPVRSGAD